MMKSKYRWIEYTTEENRTLLKTGKIIDKIRSWEVVVYNTGSIQMSMSHPVAVDYYFVLPEDSLFPILVHPQDIKQIHP